MVRGRPAVKIARQRADARRWFTLRLAKLGCAAWRPRCMVEARASRRFHASYGICGNASAALTIDLTIAFCEESSGRAQWEAGDVDGAFYGRV